MPRRLLVGVGTAREGEEARDVLVEVLEGLATLDVTIQVAIVGRARPRSDLATLADVRALPEPRPRTPAGLAESVARRIAPRLADGVHHLRTSGRRRWLQAPDCVHLNGPEAAPLLRYVRGDVPITVYVHPRDFNMAGLQPRDRGRLLARTTRFLTADDAAIDDLVAHGVDPARIEAAPDPLIFPTPLVDPKERNRARRALGVPPDTFVIGTPPVPDWIDGPDLTLALAWELERRCPTGAPTICWYGMPTDSTQRWPITYDAQRMGLSNLHITDDLPDATAPFAMFDLFDLVVLPSRSSNALPDLFVTHAAAHGTPVLCWSGHPLADDVRRWTDGVVQQPDVAAMADRVLQIADDDAEQNRLRLLGRTATMAEIERLLPLQVPVQ